MITSCISWFILDTYVDQNLSENKLWFTFVCTNVSPIPVTKNSEKKRKKRMSLPYGMVPGTVYSIYISFTFTFVSKPVFKDFICKYGTLDGRSGNSREFLGLPKMTKYSKILTYEQLYVELRNRYKYFDRNNTVIFNFFKFLRLFRSTVRT